MSTVVLKCKCETVGELLIELTKLAVNPEFQRVLTSQVTGPGGELYNEFLIVRRKYEEDSRPVLEFEFHDINFEG